LDTRAALLSPAVEIELDADQRSFRDLIRDFTDREVRPVAREMEQAGTYPGGIASKMADMGLFGLTVPTEWGGLGADTVTLAVVFEELSRGWMGIAGMIGSHGMACKLIALHGTDDQRRRHLPDLATGARRSGLALTEPDAGSDLQGIRTRAELDGDSYVVTGTKTWITNARHADPLPILVKTDPAAEPPHRGMSILLAAADTPGMEVTKDLGKLGYKGPETCEVVLDQARIPVTELLGGAEGMGMSQAISGLQTGRVNIAARAVGVAHRALEEALEYSTRRQAFGQPIGDFQAVQLKLADMATKVQAARALTWWAASRLDAGGDAVTESAMAKLFASEVALEASLESMRVHGGYGYSTEFEVERLYRDAPLMAIGEGTNDILRTVIAKGLRSEGIPE
jgi:alkylation response protein AidB-like acyl-CoA dehydrogenase